MPRYEFQCPPMTHTKAMSSSGEVDMEVCPRPRPIIYGAGQIFFRLFFFFCFLTLHMTTPPVAACGLAAGATADPLVMQSLVRPRMSLVRPTVPVAVPPTVTQVWRRGCHLFLPPGPSFQWDCLSSPLLLWSPHLYDK